MAPRSLVGDVSKEQKKIARRHPSVYDAVAGRILPLCPSCPQLIIYPSAHLLHLLNTIQAESQPQVSYQTNW